MCRFLSYMSLLPELHEITFQSPRVLETFHSLFGWDILFPDSLASSLTISTLISFMGTSPPQSFWGLPWGMCSFCPSCFRTIVMLNQLPKWVHPLQQWGRKKVEKQLSYKLFLENITLFRVQNYYQQADTSNSLFLAPKPPTVQASLTADRIFNFISPIGTSKSACPKANTLSSSQTCSSSWIPNLINGIWSMQPSKLEIWMSSTGLFYKSS